LATREVVCINALFVPYFQAQNDGQGLISSQYAIQEIITFILVLFYAGVSKSFRTGRLERELQMIKLSATRCSCIVIL
jgi:hypothetical protein